MAFQSFTVNLYVDVSGQMPYYWFTSTAVFEDTDLLKHGGNGDYSPPENHVEELHVSVMVAEATQQDRQTTINHQFILAEVSFDEITVHLDGPSGEITTVTIRSEDAEHGTKPGAFK